MPWTNSSNVFSGLSTRQPRFWFTSALLRHHSVERAPVLAVCNYYLNPLQPLCGFLVFPKLFANSCQLSLCNSVPLRPCPATRVGGGGFRALASTGVAGVATGRGLAPLSSPQRLAGAGRSQCHDFARLSA